MTDHSHSAGRVLRPAAEVRAAARRADAVTLLTGYSILLLAIPSDLVVGSFGAAGAPAALLAVALLCWYLLARQHPDLQLDHDFQPARTAGVLFGCAVLASYIAANRFAMPTLQESGAERGLITVAGWLGVCLLAADGIASNARLELLLRRVVTLAVAVAGLGIAEFLTGADLSQYILIPGLTVHTQVTDLLNRAGFVRVMSVTAQPLEFASVLAMSLPLALHQARFAPAGRRLRRWLMASVIAAAIPLSLSRTSVLTLLLTAALLLPTWSKRERWLAFLAGLAGLGLLWLAKPALLTGFGSVFGQVGTDASSASRIYALSGAVPFITAHPWFGQGLDTFFPQTYFYVDDQYLTSLIETGVVGLAALLILLGTGWFTARAARRSTEDPAIRDLGQCLAAAIAAAAISFSTYDALSFTIAPGLFFLLTGCAGALWRLTARRPGPG